jgi:hypothetical protein
MQLFGTVHISAQDNIHTFQFTICPLKGPAHQIRFA